MYPGNQGNYGYNNNPNMGNTGNIEIPGARDVNQGQMEKNIGTN
jgi:hypothetical protein